MIVVRYEEAVTDPATGSVSYTVLGIESHDGIEEVLLPVKPSEGKPIFFTKKFAGHPEYRWEVEDVGEDASGADRTYYVILNRRDQVDKADYLRNIVLDAKKKHGGFHLNEWAIVEVEFGHHLSVGKESGRIGPNKRYVDTLQKLSMPKRRLAIVTRADLYVDHGLIQVIPISSRAPEARDKTCVEVTSSLSQMVHYQKPSWAICQMIQAVPATRILAPLIKRAAHVSAVRDRAFTNRVHAGSRKALSDAMMYAVNAAGRIKDTADLAVAEADVKLLKAQVSILSSQVEAMQADIGVYERFAKDLDPSLSLAALRIQFP